jgi:hypothetical protein
MLSEREFQVLADRGLDRYDILYTDTNELVEGAEMTFEHTVTRPVPPCVLTHEALLAWVDQVIPRVAAPHLTASFPTGAIP